MIEYIVVHCSATKRDQDIGAAEIDQWHKAKGWNGIGYNYVIRRNGEIEKGRPEGATLSHAKGFNRNSIAICLVGGIDKDGDPEANFEVDQWESLRIKLDQLEAKYAGAQILGHRDLPNVAKDCPSFSVREWRKTGAVIQERKPAG